MAKHPHRLILLNKKTWRCTLEGCNFFVHLGLAHVLEGKNSICWSCGEQFTMTARALKDEMPKCDECTAKRDGFDTDAMGDYIEAQLELAKQGVKSVGELDPAKRSLIEAMKGVKFSALEQPDEIEVIEPDETHSSECGVYEGAECTCKD